jgi:predicted dehydrogenase
MSITFAAVGAAHPHVHSQITALLSAGASLKWFYDDDPAINHAIASRYEGVRLARALDEILNDPEVRLVVGTVVHQQRAALGITVMQHGKNYLCAKPGFISFEQLAEARRVQQETALIYNVFFGERLANRATVKAGELVRAGRIGQVIQTIGFGPHRLNIPTRPDWWFDRDLYGGILNDLASHQIDQFLYFTGSTDAEIVSAQSGNAKFRQFPNFEDFGDLLLRSDHATGYIRVDWLTPDGMPTWGDVRLFIVGTEGTIELRKNVDLDGQPGTDHLVVVDNARVERVSCTDVELPFARQLITDVEQRTETALPQAHCFKVCELALRAQAMAVNLPFVP